MSDPSPVRPLEDSLGAPTLVERSVDLDLPAEDLWRLVTDGWGEWLVDAADVVVEPGGGGTVVEDGTARTVRIDHRDDGDHGDQRRVGFTWWPDDRPDLASTVELVVLPAPRGSRLCVTETFVAARATVDPLAWDVRLVLLAAQALAVHV